MIPEPGDIWEYNRGSIVQTFIVIKPVINKGWYLVFSGIRLEGNEYAPCVFFTPGDVINKCWTRLA